MMTEKETFVWKKISFAEAIRLGICIGVHSDQNHQRPSGPFNRAAGGVRLKDESWVVSESHWTGPYSEVTPDIDAEEPIFWVGTSNKL